jgi:hypothetical protein
VSTSRNFEQGGVLFDVTLSTTFEISYPIEIKPMTDGRVQPAFVDLHRTSKLCRGLLGLLALGWRTARRNQSKLLSNPAHHGWPFGTSGALLMRVYLYRSVCTCYQAS